jgi:mono/diheme cytochrome c family protein
MAASLLLIVAGASASSGPDRRLGERIYREGLNARGEPVRALVGLPPAPLNGAPAACEACHALRAGAAVLDDAAPDLRWAVLLRAAELKGSGKPYTEPSFARAVTEGTSPSGEQISSAMPRYALSRSEIAALVAFLKALPAERTPR